MELKIFRDALPAAGTNCTLKAELPLETEILISDYLPPVFKLVKCFVRPVVLQKRLQPGKLQLEGYLRCGVYYQGEDGAGLCQTEQKLPFTKLLDLPEFVFTAWAVQVEGQTEYLNCRTVNPRRIEVRGAYGLVVSVHTQVKTDVITALSDGGVEQKLVTLSGVRRAAVLEKLVTVEGEIRFPTPPAAVLDLSGNASVGDLKLLNGKAVAKGVLVVSCAWRAEGDPALQGQSVNLNFNQVLDVDGLSEDCRCLCVAEPVGFTLTEGEGEEPSRLTANLMLRLRAWRPYQLQCVADAFSTKFETEQTPQTVQTESLACTLDKTVTLTGSGPLPDAGAKILACFASFGPALLAYRENNWDLTSRVTVTSFGENSLSELESYEKVLELALPLERELPSDAELIPECWLRAEDLRCVCANGTLEVTLSVKAEGAILQRSGNTCVGSIALGEPLTPADRVGKRFQQGALPDPDGQVLHQHQLVPRLHIILKAELELVRFILWCFRDLQLFQLFAAALGHLSGGSAHKIAVNIILQLFSQCYICIVLLLAQGIRSFLLRQIGGEVALISGYGLEGDLPDPGADIVQEIAVMADDQHGTGIALEVILQPFHGGKIQVVGGLVQNQDIRLLQQQLCQTKARQLTA